MTAKKLMFSTGSWVRRLLLITNAAIWVGFFVVFFWNVPLFRYAMAAFALCAIALTSMHTTISFALTGSFDGVSMRGDALAVATICVRIPIVVRSVGNPYRNGGTLPFGPEPRSLVSAGARERERITRRL